MGFDVNLADCLEKITTSIENIIIKILETELGGPVGKANLVTLFGIILAVIVAIIANLLTDQYLFAMIILFLALYVLMSMLMANSDSQNRKPEMNQLRRKYQN